MLVLVGCSSSSSAGSGSPSASASGALSATEYVTGVCSALTTFQASVQQQQASFNPNTTDLTALKQSWTDFLDGMIQDTQTLVSDIEALGVPDTSDGQAAADALKTDFGQLQQDLQQLRDQSASLSPTNPASFATDFRSLLQTFGTDLQGFGTDLQQLPSGELEAAFSAAPGCAAIGGSGSPAASASA
jgi:hypothetical protein